jgi:hypothetical protein
MAGIGAQQARAAMGEERRAAMAALGLEEAKQAGAQELQELKTRGRLEETGMVRKSIEELAREKYALEREKLRKLFGRRGKTRRAEILTHLQRLQQQHGALLKAYDYTGAEELKAEHEQWRQLYERLYGAAPTFQEGPPVDPGTEPGLPSIEEWGLEAARRGAGR